MNKLAKTYLLKHTLFSNPHGLSDKGNKCTASEIGKLSIIFMKDNFLREVANTKTYVSIVTRNN